MTTLRISLAHLVPALERYDGKYSVFEVFADDVEELHALRRGEPLAPDLDVKAHGKDLSFTVDGKRYVLTLAEKSAIARITRDAGASGAQLASQGIDGLIGGAIGLATSAKGEGWMPGMIIGVLAGAALLGQTKERSVTLRYDRQAREWRAFGGPMSQWLRQRAAAAP
jgi:hypothetical protein